MIERVRKIGLVVCVVMELAQATLLVLSVATASPPSSVADSLLHYAHYLDRASWLAFIALASATFWRLSYTWLRVIAAFLSFYCLPLSFAFIDLTRLPGSWYFIALLGMVVIGHLVRAAIALAVYRWDTSGSPAEGSRVNQSIPDNSGAG
jgi:hypothetical protein